jgi:hypothetical protein
MAIPPESPETPLSEPISNTAIPGNVAQADLYYERSFSSAVGQDDSYGVSLNYPNEPWFGDLTYKSVGADFTPSLGFVNRRAVSLYDASAGYLLRYHNYFLRTFSMTTRNQFFADLAVAWNLARARSDPKS